MAATAAALGVRTAADATNRPLIITSAELTSRYRSPIPKERAVYEPSTADIVFLVVSTKALLPPGTLPSGTTDASLVRGYDTRLVGPKPGQMRKPLFTHHRLQKDTLDLQHAFSVPIGEVGPYQLWVDGRTYPLALTTVAAPGPTETETVMEGPPNRPPASAGGAIPYPPVSASPGGDYQLCAQVEKFPLVWRARLPRGRTAVQDPTHLPHIRVQPRGDPEGDQRRLAFTRRLHRRLPTGTGHRRPRREPGIGRGLLHAMTPNTAPGEQREPSPGRLAVGGCLVPNAA